MKGPQNNWNCNFAKRIFLLTQIDLFTIIRNKSIIIEPLQDLNK